MERLVSEIRRLARWIQRDPTDLPNQVAPRNASTEPVCLTEELRKVEQRLESIQGDTCELVRRVPDDLGPVLVNLKQSMLVRLEAILHANAPGRPQGRNQQTGAHLSGLPIAAMLRLLSEQERNLFQLCFQSGFLTYREIAAHLDISAAAAKNVVNRMFLSEKKRPLFTKKYRHGVARVGLHPDMKGGVFSGNTGKEEKQAQAVVAVEA